MDNLSVTRPGEFPTIGKRSGPPAGKPRRPKRRAPAGKPETDSAETPAVPDAPERRRSLDILA
jgi:hypothetical protein